MKTALVTGGAGFLGSHLCKRLRKEGYKVYALDNLYTGSRTNLAELEGNVDFRLIEDDVIDANGNWLAVHGLGDVHFDEIYNLACPASPIHYQARPLFTTKTSIFGILNMLELAKALEMDFFPELRPCRHVSGHGSSYVQRKVAEQSTGTAR